MRVSISVRWITSALLCAWGLAGCGGGGSGAGGGAGSVELQFQQAGPAPVIQSAATDGEGLRHTLYYPSTMRSDGFPNPLVAYGNGTFAVCTGGLSEAFGRHLASWGFVVVCPEHSHTGFGTQILQAVRFMVAENGRAGSEFHGQLDIAAIGASGHSQGATGALNANVQSLGLIRSTFAFAFVDPVHHGADQPRLADVRGPVFLASGCTDPLTKNQDPYYDELPGAAARACRTNAAHVDMFRPSLAYATAWFLYTLRADPIARSAFVSTGGQEPEIAVNPGWLDWRSKRLP